LFTALNEQGLNTKLMQYSIVRWYYENLGSNENVSWKSKLKI
jgi:hypothetical protein